MTNRVRWHTPPTRPAHKAKDQENVPAGVLALNPQFSEKLDALERLLQKHGNPTSTPLGQADDFQLWAEYDREYPGQLTPKMQTPRYSYFLMAQLATADDVKAWLEEWRHAGLDLGPFAKTSFFASPNLAQQSPPHACGFHAHLDETLPNGTIRHLHDTQVAANSDPTGAARIVLGDPYLGSGLDPTRLSGVVATLEPYMACCGQPMGSRQNKNAVPPGCWIQMDPTRPVGQLVPYTLWFSSDTDTRETWQAALEDRLVPIIQTRVQTGTAFIEPEYYAKLDRDIRALLVSLSGPIQAVSNDVFDANFVGPGPLSRLNDIQKEQVRLLVSLVDRYNAPQMGACHRILQHSDEEVEDLVFHTLEARALTLRGELLKTVGINGFKIPLVSLSNFEKSLTATIAKLKQVGLDSVGDALQKVAVMGVAIVEAQQLLMERKARTEETQLPFERAVNQIGIPNLFVPKREYQNTLYEQARQVKEQLDVLLQKLQEKTNDWLRSGASGTFSLPEPKNLKDTIAAVKATAGEIEDLSAYYQKVTGILTMFNPKDDALRSVLAADEEKYLNLSSVRLMAKLRLLLARFGKDERKNVINDGFRLDIERDGILSIEAEKAEEAEAADRAVRLEREREKELERAKRAEAASKKSGEAPVRDTDRYIVKFSGPRQIQDPVIPATNEDLLGRGYKYDASSCTYDTLFAALFMIPKQWFRTQIANAKQVYPLVTCTVEEAMEVDGHLRQVIEYMEKRRGSPIKCPLMSWWATRMYGQNIESKGEARASNPQVMLLSMAKFYGIQDSVLTLISTSDRYLREPPFIVDNPKTELIVIEPRVGIEGKTNFTQIPITTADGKFTLIACIVRTAQGFHYEICMRDPRKKRWYRYDNDGNPHLLEKGQEQPMDILTKSFETKDQERKGYQYWPNYWFYVRTVMLAPLLPKFQIVNDTFKNRSKTDLLVSVFGRDFADPRFGKNLLALTQEEIQAGEDTRILGACQILYNLETNPLEGGRKGITLFSDDFKWPFTVDKVNRFLIPFIRQLFENQVIDNQEITTAIASLTTDLQRCKLIQIDKTTQHPVVADWNDQLLPEIWRNADFQNPYWIDLGKLWAVMIYRLLLELKVEKLPNDMKAKKEEFERRYQELQNKKP